MSTRTTLFTATLVQDSALSVSGLDRETSSDRPFSIVDGVPVLRGSGLKGAAVAMARRCFASLPRPVSEDPERKKGFVRSAWDFSNTTPIAGCGSKLAARAGVGILQKTGARASGILYDLEVIPAGTRWSLSLQVDWGRAGSEAQQVEGILGYILAQHWANGRCWIGGGVSRGLGWCHIDELKAFRLSDSEYRNWIKSEANTLPAPLDQIPTTRPTRSWCFRERKVTLTVGEYKPEPECDDPWGLDMLAVGSHDTSRSIQALGDGLWARPSWSQGVPESRMSFETDRAISMDSGRPILPGSSVRGPMRHAFSRAFVAEGHQVQDPHEVQGDVGQDDRAGKLFGTVKDSSRLLVCDTPALGEWAAARLHMHAEDEFTGGSFGSAKRDAVRVLKGEFPVRIVVEGENEASVQPLMDHVDHLIALGAIGHLPIGGHKTKGSGWGRWKADPWQMNDVVQSPIDQPPIATNLTLNLDRCAASSLKGKKLNTPGESLITEATARIVRKHGTMPDKTLTIDIALKAFEKHRLERGIEIVAWWCEPSIDFSASVAPPTFGRGMPEVKSLRVDEVALFFTHGSWRAARTSGGIHWVFIREVSGDGPECEQVQVRVLPARLHGDSTRFSAANTGTGTLTVREWMSNNQSIGFTIEGVH